jgi:hypothetical protein
MAITGVDITVLCSLRVLQRLQSCSQEGGAGGRGGDGGDGDGGVASHTACTGILRAARMRAAVGVWADNIQRP